MKTIKVEFVEQSKGVTAQVKIEVTDEDVDGEAVMKQSQELFDKAFKVSQAYSMRK